MEKIYKMQHIIDGVPQEPIIRTYDCDIYIEIETRFGNDDFAMEILFWVEKSKVGDRYEDEDFTIDVIAA